MNKHIERGRKGAFRSENTDLEQQRSRSDERGVLRQDSDDYAGKQSSERKNYLGEERERRREKGKGHP